MYAIILYYYMSNPYVYDVVSTNDDVNDIIKKFGGVKFGEYNNNEDDDDGDYLRLYLDTSYKWYHICNKEQNDYFNKYMFPFSTHKNLNMLIIEKKNYTINDILEEFLKI